MEATDILMREFYHLHLESSNTSSSNTTSNNSSSTFNSSTLIEDVENSTSTLLEGNKSPTNFQQYHIKTSINSISNSSSLSPALSSSLSPNLHTNTNSTNISHSKPILSLTSPTECSNNSVSTSPNWYYQTTSPTYSLNSLSYSSMSSPFSPNSLTFSPYSSTSNTTASLFSSFSIPKSPYSSISSPKINYSLFSNDNQYNNKNYNECTSSNDTRKLLNSSTSSTIPTTTSSTSTTTSTTTTISSPIPSTSTSTSFFSSFPNNFNFNSSNSTLLSDKFILNSNNIMIWHFLLKGKEKTPYQNGYYYGVLKFSRDYPLRPPCVILYTPNGKLQVSI